MFRLSQMNIFYRRRMAARVALVTVAILAGVPRADAAETSAPQTCVQVVLAGEVSAGKQWQAGFGEGWVMRLLPIPAAKTSKGVGGWDLVIDRAEPAGYPDALLLATPPYHFMNPREVGTTFGLRAQDAIGWNPRNFRFMTKRATFRKAQKLYLQLNRRGAFAGTAQAAAGSAGEKQTGDDMQRFIALAKDSSPGQFRILDARLVPGTGPVKPYAANWARQSSKTPHTEVAAPDAEGTALGKLEWIRFSVTLWLPKGWRTPRHLEKMQTPCPR